MINKQLIEVQPGWKVFDSAGRELGKVVSGVRASRPDVVWVSGLLDNRAGEVVAALIVVGTLLAVAGGGYAVGHGALSSAVLVANNLRDIPTDRETGKITLAVRLGDARTRALYTLLAAGAGVFSAVAIGIALESGDPASAVAPLGGVIT